VPVRSRDEPAPLLLSNTRLRFTPPSFFFVVVDILVLFNCLSYSNKFKNYYIFIIYFIIK
jgi:hypothetical protein